MCGEEYNCPGCNAEIISIPGDVVSCSACNKSFTTTISLSGDSMITGIKDEVPYVNANMLHIDTVFTKYLGIKPQKWPTDPIKKESKRILTTYYKGPVSNESDERIIDKFITDAEFKTNWAWMMHLIEVYAIRNCLNISDIFRLEEICDIEDLYQMLYIKVWYEMHENNTQTLS